MRDSPAYGARNVSRVAAGTGEALPGPVTCGYVWPSQPLVVAGRLVTHGEYRQPSAASNKVSCAPGCGRRGGRKPA